MSTELAEPQVVERISALVRANGSPRIAQRLLAEHGIEATERELSGLKESHIGLYQAIASEHATIAEEAIAQLLRENAALAGMVNQKQLVWIANEIEDKGIEGLDREMRRDLVRNMAAIAKVQEISVNKLLTLTGRPQDGDTSDPLEAIRQLTALGVLKPVQAIESTAEDD